MNESSRIVKNDEKSKRRKGKDSEEYEFRFFLIGGMGGFQHFVLKWIWLIAEFIISIVFHTGHIVHCNS